jgi:hypothetical protein
MADDVTYERFKELVIERFKNKNTAQYHYVRLQMATQEKNESPEMFLGRLRKMCQRTVRSSADAREQAAFTLEADARLLAAFISGLAGAPGKLTTQMPMTLDKALNMAMVATCAEQEDKATGREEREAKVFAGGGSREDTPGRNYDRPWGGKAQWSGARGARSRPQAGWYNTREGDGTHSHRTDK